MMRFKFVVTRPGNPAAEPERVTVTFRDAPEDEAIRSTATDLLRQALRTLYGGPIVQTEQERDAAAQRAKQKWFA